MTAVVWALEQKGSALMLMGLKVGAAPSSVTEPLTSPVVLASIAAPPPAGALAGAVLDSGASFVPPPQPAKVIARAAVKIATCHLLRMISRILLSELVKL